MLVLNTAQMKAVEAAAIKHGMDELRLMENAGSAAARIIRSRYSVGGKSVALLCGKGNNGGDGFVIARKLLDEGAYVKVILTGGKPATDSAAEMFARLKNTDAEIIDIETEPYIAANRISSADFIVDAVYGIGFKGRLPDRLRSPFRLVNSSSAPVIAVDVPSGVNADTGNSDPDAIKADLTITFTANKTGMTAPAAADFCGKIQVVSIGIDQSLLLPYLSDATEITHDMVKSCFGARQSDTHKGDYGRLLCFCGSKGMAGAAVLAAKAALRCGAGLVICALPESVYPIAAAHIIEPIFCPLPETENGDFALTARKILHEQMIKADTVLIGCGLGQSPRAASLVLDLLENAECPVVLDADGINIIAGHINKLKTARAPIILTPHPGEMSRLTGLSVPYIQSDRARAAREFAEETGAVVVLKGARTVIAAPGMPALVNPTGNPGMATGGSGDVLAGIIAAFCAQGLGGYQAAMCGVYLHSLAGDRAALRLSQRFMLPSDIIDELSGPFLSFENGS
ncbi:MAG TPA: NAD(P)H-hydrate dehydratase [Candidatus Avimonas sp.]|jgi:hydroxyethylthiazole kinase-like uncharacterized protein yjeF|nr:NAD(P)H-hydrate dehydratase [Clostridiales bacterium]HOB37281.1 NAD(P)H-hydrate dehydratase [Candidatus Avimonas sp.]HQA16665.1 NAD(P)H-hydrate dehydratase [Candidatus Avimonas sp.]HQD38759.1 NAD(P)H-hydrate dehydratase [Candidatus Avimonas sp.]